MRSNTLVFVFGCLAAVVLSTNGSTDSNDVSTERPFTNLHTFESSLRFKLNVEELKSNDPEECITSPEFYLNEIAWQIEGCKITEKIKEKDTVEDSDKKHTEESGGSNKKKNEKKDGGDENPEKTESFLSVRLKGKFSGETIAWSCGAEVTFNLLKSDGSRSDDKKVESTFSAALPSKGVDKIVTWDDLKKNNVKDNVATFDIKIVTKDLKRSPGLEQISSKFHMTVRELNGLGVQFSETITLRGIRWRGMARKYSDFLGLYLYANEDDLDTTMNYNVDFSYKLTSKPDAIKKWESHPFNTKSSSHGQNNFMKWAEIPDADVKANAITIEYEVTVKEPTKIK